MSQRHIERVDSLLVIIHWLLRMQMQVIIDRIWYAHSNWKGLSYGQLLATYIIHQRSHRLSSMEKWVKEHRTTLELGGALRHHQVLPLKSTLSLILKPNDWVFQFKGTALRFFSRLCLCL